jgi:hypothetical protein
MIGVSQQPSKLGSLMLTEPHVRQLLHVPGRSEVTVIELEDETLITAIVHGFEARVTDLAATMIAIADQYPYAWIDYIEPIPEGGWIVDLVARTDA